MGSKLVEGLDASEAARQRFQVILQTLNGKMAVTEACEVLGVSEAGFYKLRGQFMQDAVGLLEPKKPGRKPREVSPQEQQIQDLEAEVKHLTRELDAAFIRTEIALTMPHLMKDRVAQVKKTPEPGPRDKSTRRTP